MSKNTQLFLASIGLWLLLVITVLLLLSVMGNVASAATIKTDAYQEHRIMFAEDSWQGAPLIASSNVEWRNSSLMSIDGSAASATYRFDYDSDMLPSLIVVLADEHRRATLDVSVDGASWNRHNAWYPYGLVLQNFTHAYTDSLWVRINLTNTTELHGIRARATVPEPSSFQLLLWILAIGAGIWRL